MKKLLDFIVVSVACMVGAVSAIKQTGGHVSEKKRYIDRVNNAFHPVPGQQVTKRAKQRVFRDCTNAGHQDLAHDAAKRMASAKKAAGLRQDGVLVPRRLF